MNGSTPSPRRLVSIAVVLAVLAVVAAAYRDSLSNGFVYDDRFLVTDNALLHRPFDPVAIFGSSFWQHTPLPSAAYYRPLVITSLAIDARAGGFKPGVFHLTNLALHLANTALVAVLVQAFSGELALAASVALLFGLHPINSEAVLWVVGRCDLLALFFGLIALVLFLDDRSWLARRSPPAVRSILSAVALLLALLSKEGAVAVVAVMGVQALLLDPARRRPVPTLLPATVAAALYFGIRLAVIGMPASGSTFLGNPLIGEGSLVRIWTALELFGRYTAKLLVPIDLAADYAFASISVARSPLTPGVLGSLLALIAGVTLAWSCRERLPLFAFGVNVFLASALVVLGATLVGGGAIFAERYMYLSSAGFVLAACALARAVARTLPAPARWPAACVVVLLIGGAYFARVQSRVPDWRDDLTLFRATVATVPDNAMAHNNLAYAYWRQGDIARTKIHCVRALEIYPRFPNPLMCLGDLAMAEGSADRALGYFRQATLLGHPDGYLSLGDAYLALGRHAEARQALLAGWRANPSRARYLTHLGMVAWKAGRAGEAIEYWTHAVRLNPGEAMALFFLGNAYERHEPHLAREHYRRFLSLDPPGVDLYKTHARRVLERGTR